MARMKNDFRIKVYTLIKSKYLTIKDRKFLNTMLTKKNITRTQYKTYREIFEKVSLLTKVHSV
jgi:hypothetical protein